MVQGPCKGRHRGTNIPVSAPVTVSYPKGTSLRPCSRTSPPDIPSNWSHKRERRDAPAPLWERAGAEQERETREHGGSSWFSHALQHFTPGNIRDSEPLLAVNGT